MPSRFEAPAIHSSYRPSPAGRRDRPAGASSTESAARLAAEAAFSGGPGHPRAPEQPPVTIVRKKLHLQAAVAHTSSPAPLPADHAEMRAPRVFRVAGSQDVTAGAEACAASVDGLEPQAGAGIACPSPDSDAAEPEEPARRVRHRRATSELSGPVTVSIPPPPADAQPRVPGAGQPTSSDTRRARDARAPSPTLDELAGELSSASATLESLRRTPVHDFLARHDEAAWERLSREADKLLAEVRRVKPRKIF